MNWSALMWWRPPCLLRPVIVNLVSDPEHALKGVLWQCRGAWLVLKDATVLKAGSPALKVDGEVVIYRSNVAFIEVLP